MAEPHSRVRSWATIAAFTLIIALTVAEGIDEGFSIWDWLIMGLAHHGGRRGVHRPGDLPPRQQPLNAHLKAIYVVGVDGKRQPSRRNGSC